ncbi:MAG: Hcp family type VI secretion system effector [Gammaproteobacteria bacterium]
MPIPAYMSIEGESQGDITEGCNTADSIGNIYQEEHEDEFLVLDLEHQIVVPTDKQSGQPTGYREHKWLTVMKYVDKATPLLYQALVSGERLPTCEIKYYRTSQEGQEEHYYTIELEDAVIVSIVSNIPDALAIEKQHLGHMEKVSFTYRAITWTHEIAGTEGTDDWRAKAAD